MKRIIVFCVDKFRRLKHYVSTFILKHQLVAYGDHVGAARYIKISRRKQKSLLVIIVGLMVWLSVDLVA